MGDRSPPLRKVEPLHPSVVYERSQLRELRDHYARSSMTVSELESRCERILNGENVYVTALATEPSWG